MTEKKIIMVLNENPQFYFPHPFVGTPSRKSPLRPEVRKQLLRATGLFKNMTYTPDGP